MVVFTFGRLQVRCRSGNVAPSTLRSLSEVPYTEKELSNFSKTEKTEVASVSETWLYCPR